MSRTVPAVTDKYVVTIGPKCHVMCVDAVSGDFRWGIDLVREYGAEVPLWYTGQCPLIDGSLAVFAVGGRSLIIAVDCETGEVVWEVPNPNDWKMSHSSIMPFFIQGKKMYVYCALGGIIGISAEKETAGEILFETNLWDRNVIAPSPIHIGDGRIFVTAGYGGGSMMLKLNFEDGSFSVESLQELKPEEGLASEQQTPIFYKGHLFSLLPRYVFFQTEKGALGNRRSHRYLSDWDSLLWLSGHPRLFSTGPRESFRIRY
jgi:outer membrane protein assembly factor BamB